MPQINLLSPGSSLKKQKAKEAKGLSVNSPQEEFIAVSQYLIRYSLISLGIVFIWWIFLSKELSIQVKKLEKIDQEQKNLALDPKEIERFRSERTALEKKVQLIDRLSSRKFYYFQKLELISALIPDGVWLKSIQVFPTSATPTKQQKAAKSNFTESVAAKSTFIVNGTAVANTIEDAVTLIGKYIDSLKNNSDFSKDFSDIKLNNVAKEVFGGRDVMTFDLECITN